MEDTKFCELPITPGLFHLRNVTLLPNLLILQKQNININLINNINISIFISCNIELTIYLVWDRLRYKWEVPTPMENNSNNSHFCKELSYTTYYTRAILNIYCVNLLLATLPLLFTTWGHSVVVESDYFISTLSTSDNCIFPSIYLRQAV